MHRTDLFRRALIGFVALTLLVGSVSPGAVHAQGATPAADSAGADESAAFRGGAGRDGYDADAGPKGTPLAHWRFRTGDRIFSSPLVVGDTVYVGSNDHNFYAIDANSGLERWSFDAGHEIGSSPALANDTVFFGDVGGTLHALDAATGAPRWSFETNGAIISSPVVQDGVLYVGSDDSILYAIGAVDGVVRWRFQAAGMIESSPAVVAGVVYIGSLDDYLYAVDAATGAERWNVATGGDIFSTPAVARGSVYVGSVDGKLYAVDATTGSVRWTLTTGDAIYSSPAVSAGVVYIGSYDKQLYAADAESGAELWRYDVGSEVFSSPVVAGGYIYVGAAGGLGAPGGIHSIVKRSGEKRWVFPVDVPVYSTPAIRPGMIYIGAYDGALRAIGGSGEAPDGALNALIPSPEECVAEPRPLADIQQLQQEGLAQAAEESTSDQSLTAEGDVVNAATVGSIAATLRHLYACVNADNPKRALSLYSDRFVARALARVEPIDEAAYEALDGSATNTDTRRGEMPAIGWVRLLDDGRVRAQVQSVSPNLPDAGIVAYYTFVRENNTWVIDDIAIQTTSDEAE